jgi:trehalose 6-phosphate synthase
MKQALRFIIPLFLVISSLIFVSVRFVDSLQERWFIRDLNTRSELIANLVLENMSSGKSPILTQTLQDDRPHWLPICDENNTLLSKGEALPDGITCAEINNVSAGTSYIKKSGDQKFHVYVTTLGEIGPGKLAIIHDMGFVNARNQDTRKYVLVTLIAFAVFSLLVTLAIAQVSWQGWLKSMRLLVSGVRGIVDPPRKALLAFTPIVKDLRKLVRDLESRRIARDDARQTWTPKLLKEILHDELSDEQVIIVANREPFIHNKTESGIEVQHPASGLVTALEPIMEACSGVWIAHGSGSADKEVVDEKDKVYVPPENPTYAIKRIWLSKEEEEGYYYGFANEGLWPLCHIAHTRPIFRTEDYEQYKKVNARFAQAIVEEAKSDEPVILIQDYHFALLPSMIRKRLPKAVIITFWHIPWPNPEVFGICPWREELLEGLLGSSIVGFHTQFHCNNFFETVDRFLECRIDREGSAISHGGDLTGVKPYPISIEWPPKLLKGQKSIRECREEIRAQFNLPIDIKIGIGVDRLDYTKGIVERLMAVDRFLKTHPQWIGKFTFIQIAAPSRSRIPSYKLLHDDVLRVTEEINQKYQSGNYKPIILKMQHFESPEVYKFFRAADICYVSSLHDGMNLVAKEFIASREDEKGVLVLSSFTGASRELPEALIVIP